MSHKPGPDPARLKTQADPRTYGSATLPAEPVFAGLLKDWPLQGCVRIVNASPLSGAAGRITGAAVWDRRPSGTGWPVGASR